MYLSRLWLDTGRRSTMKALAAPNLIHGVVEQAFAGERTRKLWRVDTFRGEHYLLLLSVRKPDLMAAVEQLGQPGTHTWDTKNYEPLLARATEGTVWQFRLTANPTKSCSQKGNPANSRGRVHAHITTEYQEEWLLKRAKKHGFLLQQEDFRVVGAEWKVFRKGSEGNRVTLLAVTYEGVLTVSDEALFRSALTEGIGRGKAYGMGMLTIVRPVGSRNG